MARSNISEKQIKKLIADMEKAGAIAKAQMDEQKAEREAREAAFKESEERRENPMKFLTNEDIKAIDRRLGEILQSCYSINRLTLEAIGQGDGDPNVMMAVSEMARANVKGLDACIKRLGGMEIGLFAGEFSEE